MRKKGICWLLGCLLILCLCGGCSLPRVNPRVLMVENETSTAELIEYINSRRDEEVNDMQTTQILIVYTERWQGNAGSVSSTDITTVIRCT